MENKKLITVIVEGGCIQEILDIPDDVKIEVRDFDCDDLPDPDDEYNCARENEDGDIYWESMWENNDV